MSVQEVNMDGTKSGSVLLASNPGDSSWGDFKSLIDDRRAWSSARLDIFVQDLRTQSAYAGAWWNELEVQIPRYRLWPTRRLTDLMDRIENDQDPLHAGYMEMLHASD